MLSIGYAQALRRLQWAKYRNTLDTITTMDQFNALMAVLNEQTFRRYEHYEKVVDRQEPGVLLNRFGLDLRGRTMLDVGPGFGSTIDSAKAQGAICEYVEYNPFFHAFNRLKGFAGYRLDARHQLHMLPRRKYDIVWVKQTFVGDRFLYPDLMQRMWRYPKIDRLLDQLEDLATDQGLVAFCPHWQFDSKTMVRKIEDVWNTPIAHSLRRREYEVVPSISGHNVEPFSPVTFVKRLSRI
jgi:hypothetical protein